ncbi:MAG: rhodanese-like domain-containing protein [Candidatus Omnitrophica bacterium]|nr:rhodanese-like domain-containing protein [Candidatus Omnitrophota bacterium]
MIKEIDRNGFLKLKNSKLNNLKVVDMQKEIHFVDEHIPGALSIPFEKVEVRAVMKLRRDDHIIVYGNNTDCIDSPIIAKKLDALGFEHIYVYTAGMADYKKARLPLEGRLHPHEVVI